MLKEILEKICKIGSNNAKAVGRNIDYDKLFYIKFFQDSSGYGWRLVAFDPLNNNRQTELLSMNGKPIDLGEMFLREVPAIERGYEIEKILNQMFWLRVGYTILWKLQLRQWAFGTENS